MIVSGLVVGLAVYWLGVKRHFAKSETAAMRPVWTILVVGFAAFVVYRTVSKFVSINAAIDEIRTQSGPITGAAIATALDELTSMLLFVASLAVGVVIGNVIGILSHIHHQDDVAP